jgi:hypothetical protein
VSLLLTGVALACAARLIWVDFRRLEIETPTLLVLGSALLIQSAVIEGAEGALPRLLAAGGFYLALRLIIRHVRGLGRIGAGDPPLIAVISFMVFPLLVPWAIVAAGSILMTAAAYARARRKRFLRSMFPAAPPLLLAALPFYLLGLGLP